MSPEEVWIYVSSTGAVEAYDSQEAAINAGRDDPDAWVGEIHRASRLERMGDPMTEHTIGASQGPRAWCTCNRLFVGATSTDALVQLLDHADRANAEERSHA